MAKSRAITIADLFAIKNVNDAQIAPDGARVVYTQTEADLENNRYYSNLWIVPSDGSAPPRQFTYGKQKDRAPRWSPDGKRILFISDRSGEDRFYLISADGGEAERLESGKIKPGAAVWSADGKRIAFVSKPEAKEREYDTLHVTRLQYKMDGEGFWDGRWRQIYMMDVSQSNVVQMTDGDFDHGEPAWSPDGSEIAFSANRDGTGDTTNLVDLWAVNVRTKKLRRLTQHSGPCNGPSYSPDGKWIAFFAHNNAYKSTTNLGVHVIAARSRGVNASLHNLCADFDNSAGTSILNDMRAPAHGAPSPVWSADGKRLFFLTTVDGTSQVYSANMDCMVTPVTSGQRQVYSYSYAPAAQRFAFAASQFTLPCDIYAVDASGANEQRLSDSNQAWRAGVELSEPEAITFGGAEGWPVQGWIMKPVGFKKGKRYPLILQIHGGPHAAYGHTFFHEMQFLAALGYGVLFTNPRGSVGYGQRFVSATHHDWGGNDYRDCMAAVDWALANVPWVDAKRLGVTGGSYGGYMTNWIVTQTDRFKAAIADRSISNRHSKFGSADISYFDGEWEFDGEAYDNPDFYLKRSPITYVRNVKTPLLLQHSEVDLRCPMEQAEQFFIAIKKIGQAPVELVRYPAESHDLSRNGQPKHRKERLEHIERWFGKYL